MKPTLEQFVFALRAGLTEMIEQPFDHDPGERAGLRMALDLVNMVSKVEAPEPPPRHPMSKEYLQEAARAVQAKLPDNHGFFLFVAPYGAGVGRSVYVSTMTRETAINAMKECIIKAGAGEDWLKHLP